MEEAALQKAWDNKKGGGSVEQKALLSYGFSSMLDHAWICPMGHSLALTVLDYHGGLLQLLFSLAKIMKDLMIILS